MKVRKLQNLWQGETVVCIASGPSLNKEDCELVRQSKKKVIVCNNTFEIYPEADILYAYDAKWWSSYEEKVKTFTGLKVTHNANMYRDVLCLNEQIWFEPYGNSGAAAISLAINMGAKNIILLGYECSKTNNKSHWHDDHQEDKGLSNCRSIDRWPKQFEKVANHAWYNEVNIINCSRNTALKCFKLGVLSYALTAN